MSDEAASPSAANRWKMRALWIAVIGGLVAVFAMLQIPPPRHFTCGYSCLANLKQIDGAVQQWALENGKKPTDTYSFSDPAILAYLKGSMLPTCPEHGRYLPGTCVTNVPRCTIRGPMHSL